MSECAFLSAACSLPSGPVRVQSSQNRHCSSLYTAEHPPKLQNVGFSTLTLSSVIYLMTSHFHTKNFQVCVSVSDTVWQQQPPAVRLTAADAQLEIRWTCQSNGETCPPIPNACHVTGNATIQQMSMCRSSQRQKENMQTSHRTSKNSMLTLSDICGSNCNTTPHREERADSCINGRTGVFPFSFQDITGLVE